MPQSRLIGLLDYIEHVEKLNRTPAFVVPTEYFCRYESDLRNRPGLEFDLPDDVWLRVPRLTEQPPPTPPDQLRPWMVVSNDPQVRPSLRDEILVPSSSDAPAKQILRRDVPHIDGAFLVYVEGPWTKWSSSEVPRRQTIQLYGQLYVLLQALEAEGAETPLEIVWGMGIAVWKHPAGHTVRCPIITQLVEIALDPRTLVLEISPRERPAALDMDVFAELGVPGVVHVESAWRKFTDDSETGLSPFNSGEVQSILKATVGFLDASGVYWPEQNPDKSDRSVPHPQARLIVTDNWVIFARKRSPNFLIADIAKLRAALEALKSTPGGPAALVTALPGEAVPKARCYFRGFAYAAGRIPPGVTPSSLYFPKPYNDEQISIIEKLETSAGVVVQGPPGTGKTHTIANVICHYLALGKQVLVTSKGEPALAVLREQIPESIRALSVALLTDEKDGMRQFEHAIQSIASTVSRIHPEELDANIEGLEHRITQLHAQLSAIDTDISRWAEAHFQQVNVAGREMLPGDLARLVCDEEPIHCWFPDRLNGDLRPPEIREADIDLVREARRRVGSDLHYIDVALPAVEVLPSAQTVAQAHEALRQAKAIEQHLSQRGSTPLVDRTPERLQKAEHLVDELSAAIGTYEQIHELQITSSASLHAAYVDGRSPVLATLNELLKDAQELEIVHQKFLQRPVDMHADAELDPAFEECVRRLQDGKSAFAFLGGLGKADLKNKISVVRVAALPPRSADDWAHVRAALEFRRSARAYIARWAAGAREAGLPHATGMAPDGLRSVFHHVSHLARIRKLAIDHRSRIEALHRDVFGVRVGVAGITGSRSALADLRQLVQHQTNRAKLERYRSVIGDATRNLPESNVPILQQMRQLLQRKVGSNLEHGRVREEWAQLLTELRRVSALRGSLDEIDTGTKLVRSAGSPKWADALRNEPHARATDPWTPANWLEAWRWRQAATFLDAIDGREALITLQARRKTAENDLARAYEGLVEQKTWVEVFRNSPPSVKAALQSYLVAVRKIGKGTGIRAARFRKEARNAMVEAYRAVPCWIMPEWRVSETLPAEIGKFDLVVIDEASQSDVWALPALLRGKKLLVVGDDKQVSPDGIGLSEERIKDLKNRFLRSQVHGDLLTPEKSLYDLAKVVFAGELVMLREHFRCVAPIIEFSKRQFYNHEIRPLRVPRASERLDPPLIDVFVRGGARSGASNKINEGEARGIVEEIKVLLKDPRCANRTIGVVSLLGSEQAHRIFELIRREVPTEEIVARKITVGDARTFQGKERDVMFLSMVATREANTAATMQMYEQRFNVAASRARDRMYLFRSIELPDLNKVDLKALLIEHFSAPFHQAPERVKSLRELCESDFEREMFDALCQAGYRVQPQVQVGGFRIDFVVDGTEDRRLAVECDGDKYHGPGHWNHDMARQRILERAGWTFWRCFGSSFARKKKEVLGDLFGTLNKLGIEPIGAREADLGRFTEHREISPFGPPKDTSTAPQPVARSRPSGQQAGAKCITTSPDGRVPASAQMAKPTRLPPKQNEMYLRQNESDRSDREEPSPLELAVARLVNHHSIKWEDNRKKGGALWLYIGGGHPVAHSLKTWGFEFKPGKGWWKK